MPVATASLRPYSMSRLTEYERCPQRFYFKYIEGLPEIIEDPGQFGSIVHQAIAAALKGEDWKSILVELDLERIEEAKIKVLSAVKWSRQLGQIVGIETKFAVDEDYNLVDFDSDDAFLRGIVDLITTDGETLQVWDWKTGHSTPKMFQVMLYAYVIQKALGKPVTKAGYILLSTHDILEYDIDEDELEITAKKLWKTIMKLERDEEFNPRPGNHCAFCSYVAMCPLVQSIQAKDIPAIRTFDEAKQVAQEIIALEDKVKRYKNYLKEFAKEFGPIEIDNGRWELESTEFVTLKRGTNRDEIARRVLQLCEEKGLDPLQFFDLKVSALDGVISEVERRKRLNFKFNEFKEAKA